MRKHSNYACKHRVRTYPGPDDTGANVTYRRVANSTNDPTLYSLVLETAWCTPLRAHNFFNFTAVSRVFGILSLCVLRLPSSYLISCLRPSPIPPLISSSITACNCAYKTFLQTFLFPFPARHLHRVFPTKRVMIIYGKYVFL